jgi:hypothetical protein
VWTFALHPRLMGPRYVSTGYNTLTELAKGQKMKGSPTFKVVHLVYTDQLGIITECFGRLDVCARGQFLGLER